MEIRIPKRVPPAVPEARDYELIPVVYSGNTDIHETNNEYIITVNSSDAWIVIYDRGKRAVAEYTVEGDRLSKILYSKYLEQYL